MIDGEVAAGFEEVRAQFERNFRERGELGAAVAAYWRGRKVVDLWGGRRTPGANDPWAASTLVLAMSTTKGLAAMTLAIAAARGWLDYDQPVEHYWPEFGQNGKRGITVRQLLDHEAGLVVLDETLTIDQMEDLDAVAHLLARQRPVWPPGTRHGYHAMTIGLYMQELVRHVDPRHRTLGHFLRDELATPLGIELYIGLPREIADERLARLDGMSRLGALRALRTTPPALIRKILTPGSLLRRSLLFSDVDINSRQFLSVELPAANGVVTARSVARAYAAFAEGGAELGITPAVFERLVAPPSTRHPFDEVLGVPSYYSLGFLRSGTNPPFGSTARSFGAPGAGGSFAFADPDARLGYAYVMNRLGYHLFDDPREKGLREALYRSIAIQAARAA